MATLSCHMLATKLLCIFTFLFKKNYQLVQGSMYNHVHVRRGTKHVIKQESGKLLT